MLLLLLIDWSCQLNCISKYGWWLNELETLGIKTERRNEFNDLKEISNLTENVKQELYEYYKDAYNVYNTYGSIRKRKQEINEPDTNNSRRKQKQISVSYIRFKERRH